MSTEFVWTTDKIEKLRARIAAQPKAFSILSEPLLASLACCRGIQFELNTPLNRLPAFVGLDADCLWASKIVRGDFGYELELWPQTKTQLQITNEALIDLISKKSLSEDGQLHRLVINPLLIAEKFKAKGVDLVVVRDWILASGLAANTEHAVYYVKANPWELRNNVGYQQCELLVNYQLPFFGTHDMVDHVAGSTGFGLSRSHPAISDVYRTMHTIFNREPLTEIDLLYAYLLSLLLDDLGQPYWYGSQAHERAMAYVVQEWLGSRDHAHNVPILNTVPEKFFTIMDHVRKHSDWSTITDEIDALKSIWQPRAAV